jgi:hypothetical protein
VFVAADSNDLLLGWQSWIELPEPVPERTVTHWIEVPFSHDDGVGYSDWDYTLTLRAVFRQIADGLAPVVHPQVRPHQGSAPADWTGTWQSGHVTCSITAHPGDGELHP